MFFVGLSLPLEAQTDENTMEKGLFVKVEVSDPAADLLIYSGHIIEGTNCDTLYILTKFNRVVRIPFSDIITIETNQSKPRIIERDEERENEKIEERVEEREENVYGFEETGIYISAGPDISFVDNGFLEAFPGIELTAGYKFKRMLALGVGVARRDWTYDVWPSRVGHVFGEIRGFFLPKNSSPYYRVKVGYGNAWTGVDGNFNSAKGGLYFSPSVGIRLFGGALFKMNIETGLNHQEITYLDLDFGSFERKYTFNRHYIGISMMF
jgi:hypothetical protein